MTVSIDAVAQALQFIEEQHMAVLKYGDKEMGRHRRRANAAIKHAEASEAERDRLAGALRRIADGTWTPTTGDSISPREYARAALAHTEQP